MSDRARKAALDGAIQYYARNRFRVEHRSDFQATIVLGREIGTGLHVFLSIITVGLWLPVWGLIKLAFGIDRRLLTVDEYGNVIRQKL